MASVMSLKMIKGSPLIAEHATIREKYLMMKKLSLVCVILVIILAGCGQKKMDNSNLIIRILTKGITHGIEF